MSTYDEMYRLANQQQTYAKQLATDSNQFNASEAEKQRQFEKQLFNAGNSFNAAEAAKNRNWQEAMSNSAHQREIADLQAAGLNPILSATGGNGAAVTSGATASSLGAPSGAHATADTSANAAIAQIYGSLMSFMSNTEAMKTSAAAQQRIASIQADTQRYVAGMNADASRFASTASMYNAALQAATNKAINSAQLAKQQELAEYDFEKQMQYRSYDRESQWLNAEHSRSIEEEMKTLYPNNAWQAFAALGQKFGTAVHNLVDTIRSVFTPRPKGKF